MKKIILAALCIVCVFYIQAAAESNWKLEKDKDGIKVWTRKPANATLKEYKATTIIETTTSKLISFFKNYTLFDKWMYKVDEGSVKLVKKNDDNDYYILMTMSAPFIKSRESITHFVFNKPDPKGIIVVNLDAAPDLLPLNDKYIRIPRMKAYWKFVPLPNGKVEVTHQALSSTGGSLPEAIANLGIVDAPYSMLEKLKELIK
ncbi:MAG: hypothetical protein JWN78_1891 [Bacteroidota bacterium]|nr:hypothetical protein [Bacteroidota bacterium]